MKSSMNYQSLHQYTPFNRLLGAFLSLLCGILIALSFPIQAGAQDSKTGPILLYESSILRGSDKQRTVSIDIDLKGASKIFLVVTDGGDSNGYDWADWISPVLKNVQGEKLNVTTVEWLQSFSSWGKVHIGRSTSGKPMTVHGELQANGIGTHANSVVEIEVPDGFERFAAIGAIDDGATVQKNGGQASIRFKVYGNQLPANWKTLDEASLVPETNPRHPVHAVDSLDAFAGCGITLASAEPQHLSLSNIDVDHRGRLWVCEIVNYRAHNGKRPEGDRILILEDTNGDGVMDDSKVYYEGADVNSAMGICVLGNRVIVSASPNIWIFTDENGDDVPDSKQLFFSETGVVQHDHSAHSFVFGPDGKLVWNMGNYGRQVKDSQGRMVIDTAGNEVKADGKPYYGGMVFRNDLDGSNFEVIAHNFRNNYEVAIDSFGTLWQSDNDDDGNRSVRINYVMEYGNFGYLDELTGAGWQVPRTNLEATIEGRHWHSNDPGVVPNIAITGAGAPSGITVYEGSLLPREFQNQMIHCDAGRNVVWAHQAQEDGAGYTAATIDLLKGTRDRWFRPVDVSVAPDGSVFISDWYDPGVGGHHMGDTARGRLFRVAPTGQPYRIPKFDFSTAVGAVEALQNPNNSVRYLAWSALLKMGDQARPALESLATHPDPRMRARGLWVLGKLPTTGKLAVASALADTDENVRTVGIRLARQLKVPVNEIAAKVLADSSPVVRRELALALHLDSSEHAPKIWASLANRYDGQDRWYLEALGIGAANRWDECYREYQTLRGREKKGIDPDIAWRSRSELACQDIENYLVGNPIDRSELLRMLRALEYHSNAARNAVLSEVANRIVAHFDKLEGAQREDASWAVVQVLLRVADARKLSENAAFATVIENQYASVQREEQLKILENFAIVDALERMWQLAASEPTDSAGVKACGLLLEQCDAKWLADKFTSEPSDVTMRFLNSASNCDAPAAAALLEQVMRNDKLPETVRMAAVKGLAQHKSGPDRLLTAARSDTLPAAARLVAASALRTHANPNVRQDAQVLFPLPMSNAKTEVPDLNELVARSGNAMAGERVFHTIGTCSSCHRVGTIGKAIGPDLTEIGSKLAKEAMYVAILDPSAAVNHSYETFTVLLEDDDIATGLLISDTNESITLKDNQGIERTFNKSAISDLRRNPKSMMPENLIEQMTVTDLVDLVEYLMTLQKN